MLEVLLEALYSEKQPHLISIVTQETDTLALKSLAAPKLTF